MENLGLTASFFALFTLSCICLLLNRRWRAKNAFNPDVQQAYPFFRGGLVALQLWLVAAATVEAARQGFFVTLPPEFILAVVTCLAPFFSYNLMGMGGTLPRVRDYLKLVLVLLLTTHLTFVVGLIWMRPMTSLEALGLMAMAIFLWLPVGSFFAGKFALSSERSLR